MQIVCNLNAILRLLKIVIPLTSTHLAKVFVEEPLNVLSVQPDSIISFNCTLNLSVFECQDDGVLLEWHTPFVPLALHESGGQFNNVLGEFEWLSIQSSSQGCLLTKTLQFVAKEQYNKYAFQCAVGKVTHAIEKIWSKAAVLVGKSVDYVFTNTREGNLTHSFYCYVCTASNKLGTLTCTCTVLHDQQLTLLSQ